MASKKMPNMKPGDLDVMPFGPTKPKAMPKKATKKMPMKKAKK